MKRTLASALLGFLTAALLALSLASCQQLFTTSLAKSLARSSLPIPSNLSTDDAAALAAQAKASGDTKLANALVTSLVAQIATTTDPNAKKALEAAAASAAVTASGLSSTLSGLISSNLENGTVPDASSILAEIQASTTPNILTALSYLNPATGGLGTSASATDYVIAAAVVAASAIPADTKNPATYTPTPGTAEAAAIANAESILKAGAPLVATDPSAKDLYDQIASAFSLSLS
jgi:hypothetical protein